MLKKYWRVGSLAKMAGVSEQTIRNYEVWGFIPEVERSTKGYRLYTSRHKQALRVARTAINAYGWKRTRKIMEYVHKDNLSAALSEIDARHAEIHQNRKAVEETLKILRVTSATLPTLENIPHHRNGMHIGEVAKSVGIPASSVRFWESRGLLQPGRDKTNRYRVYDAEEIRRLQVVALLRKANYDFEVIANVLNQLANSTPEEAMIAAEQRLKDLAEQSRHCAEATAMLWQYIDSDL
jgi:DNA-binding transcriptional MerR regulator